MITVRCSSGDVATAPTELAALVAARTLCEDAWAARPLQGHAPTVTFLVAGRIVMAGVGEAEIWKALGGAR